MSEIAGLVVGKAAYQRLFGDDYKCNAQSAILVFSSRCRDIDRFQPLVQADTTLTPVNTGDPFEHLLPILPFCERYRSDMPDLVVANAQTLYILARSTASTSSNWRATMCELSSLKHLIAPHEFDTPYQEALKKVSAEIKKNEPAYESMKVPNHVFFARFKFAHIRLYPHDELHQATCYYDEPLYMRLKSDVTQAYVSPTPFLEFSFKDKLRLVREEAYAFALERVLLPFLECGKVIDPSEAYAYAIFKICTDATRGWFRDFAVDHFEMLDTPDVDYLGLFKKADQDGKAKRLPVSDESLHRERLAAYVAEIERRLSDMRMQTAALESA